MINDKIGILFVHGIGKHTPNYAKELIKKIKNELTDINYSSEKVCFEAAYWHTILQEREDELWNDLTQKHDLDYSKLRRFIIDFIGDSIAYQGMPYKDSTYYDVVNKDIHQSIQKIKQQIGSHAPLIIVTFSLGNLIISNYIWDRQQGYNQEELGQSPIERMETLCGLLTFGSNLPLFTLSFDKKDIKPIQFPPNTLSHEQKEKAQWLNFYDKDDILGYPLKPINDHYSQTVAEDISIKIGNILTSWNPAVHLEYRKDQRIAYFIAKYLSRFIKK